MMKKLILIGANGLVGQDFYHRFYSKYCITQVDKDNILGLEKMLTSQEYDYLIFLAQSADYKVYPYSQNLIDVNVNLLRLTLEKAIGKVENIVYFSSGSVYQESDLPLTERSKLKFADPTPYIASKISGELTLLSMKKSFKTVTIFRPFFIYGQFQNQQMLLPSLIEKVIQKQTITLNDGKGMVFNPTFVSDVSDYLSFIIDNNIESHIQNIYGSEVVSIKNICDRIGKLCNITPNYEYFSMPAMNLVSATENKYYSPKSILNECLEVVLDSKLKNLK